MWCVMALLFPPASFQKNKDFVFILFPGKLWTLYIKENTEDRELGHVRTK